MTQDGSTVRCRYCDKQTETTATRKCNLCWVVDLSLDEFVRSDAGLVRALEAISKRPPMPAGAAPLAEAIAIGTSGQAGSSGQLLAAELLVLQATLERVRAVLQEQELRYSSASCRAHLPPELNEVGLSILQRFRIALGDP